MQNILKIIILTIFILNFTYSKSNANEHLFEIKTTLNNYNINSDTITPNYQSSKNFGFSYLYNFNNLYLGIELNNIKNFNQLKFTENKNSFNIRYFNNKEYSFNIKYNFYTFEKLRLLIGLNLGFNNIKNNLDANILNFYEETTQTPETTIYEENDIIVIDVPNDDLEIENYLKKLCPRNNFPEHYPELGKLPIGPSKTQITFGESFTCEGYKTETKKVEFYENHHDKIIFKNNIFVKISLQSIYKINNYIYTSAFAAITNYQNFQISKNYNNLYFNTHIYAQNYSIGVGILINVSEIYKNLIIKNK